VGSTRGSTGWQSRKRGNDEYGRELSHTVGTQARDLRAAIDGSLQRLGTDYIDLYQIHYPDSTTPFAETIGALLAAQREGKIRYFGVSNFTTAQLREWMAAGPLHAAQPCYHMFQRG
jgi:aryl-alcohol dehydrogenase-like predicted oxidoreductase